MPFSYLTGPDGYAVTLAQGLMRLLARTIVGGNGPVNIGTD
jgi:hypothetical protein